MLQAIIPKIIFNPNSVFENLRDNQASTMTLLLTALIPLALIGPIAAFFGTTQIGWSVANGPPVTLTTKSALQICAAYFAGIVVATLTVARFIQWMSETYGEQQEFTRCLLLAISAAAPLYLCGLLQAWPIVWLNYIIGLPVLAYSVYLLYLGINVLLEVPKDRAFLFGSAVLAVGMVALVGLLAATVALWGYGIAPSFTGPFA